MQINAMNQVRSCDREFSAHLVSKYDLICQLAVALLLDGKVLIEFSPSVKRCIIAARSENYNLESWSFKDRVVFSLYIFHSLKMNFVVVDLLFVYSLKL